MCSLTSLAILSQLYMYSCLKTDYPSGTSFCPQTFYTMFMYVFMCILPKQGPLVFVRFCSSILFIYPAIHFLYPLLLHSWEWEGSIIPGPLLSIDRMSKSKLGQALIQNGIIWWAIDNHVHCFMQFPLYQTLLLLFLVNVWYCCKTSFMIDVMFHDV